MPKGTSKVFYKIRDARGMRGLVHRFQRVHLLALSIINLPLLFCLANQPVISLRIETMAYAFITSFTTFFHPLRDLFV